MDTDFFKDSTISSSIIDVFEEIPGYLYFVKNRNFELVAVNQRLADLIPVEDKSQILGMTDHDYLSDSLADAYRKNDVKVLQTGEKIVNKVELITNKSGNVDWSNTTKVPIRNDRGEIIGILGITRPYQGSIMAKQADKDLGNTMEIIRTQYHKNLNIQELAKSANMSCSSFERKFKASFNITPKAYILRVRVQQACHALVQTTQTISEIALALGFSDQSHLTREFKKVMKETPKKYRDRYRTT